MDSIGWLHNIRVPWCHGCPHSYPVPEREPRDLDRLSRKYTTQLRSLPSCLFYSILFWARGSNLVALACFELTLAQAVLLPRSATLPGYVTTPSLVTDLIYVHVLYEACTMNYFRKHFLESGYGIKRRMPISNKHSSEITILQKGNSVKQSHFRPINIWGHKPVHLLHHLVSVCKLLDHDAGTSVSQLIFSSW